MPNQIREEDNDKIKKQYDSRTKEDKALLDQWYEKHIEPKPPKPKTE